MKKVICISGKAQNGKDTSATILKAALEGRDNKVLILHYADLLKYFCREYFNWDGIKDAEGRTLLQHVGTEVVRTKNPNYWVDFVVDFLKLFEEEWDYVLIPDCRFPNEVSLIGDTFQTVHLRVVRPYFMSPLTEEQQNHPSETALDDYPFDYLILNDGSVRDLGATLLRLTAVIDN